MRPVFRFLQVIEVYLRLILVNLPTWALERVPELNRLAALLFMYFLMLFVGLLWSFMTNAAMSLSLSCASFIAGATQQLSPLQAVSSFYVWYATFRVLISFGKKAAMTAWESLDDFPTAAKAVVSSVDLWWYFTPIMFVPVFSAAVALLIAPYLCKPPYVHPYAELACQHTLLQYMTLDHRPVRKTVTFTIVILVCQLLQALLHQFPQWRPTLRQTPAYTRYALQSSLLVLLVITVLLGFTHIQQHSWYAAVGLAPAPTYNIAQVAWRWPALIIAWLIWFEALVTLLIKYGKDAWRNVVTIDNAQRMFRNSRISLLTFIFLEFFWASVHSDIGFLEAQLQFTIFTLVVPVVYVMLYIVADISLQLPITLIIAAMFTALVASVTVCYFAGVGGPGSVSVVFCHVFGKIIQIFGTHEAVEFSVVDENEFQELASDSGEVTTNGDTVLQDKGSEQRTEPTSPHTSKPRKQPDRQKTKSQKLLLPTISAITKHLPDSSRDLVKQISSVSDKVLANLTTSPLVQVPLLSGLKDSYLYRWIANISYMYLSIIRVLFLPSSLYEGIGKAAIGVIILFSLLFGTFSVASIIQTKIRWFPDLIEFTNTPKSFFIDHAKISTVELLRPSTTSPADSTCFNLTSDSCPVAEEPWPRLPKYAFCDSTFFGLTMLDYALLAEIAYFDDKAGEIQEILDGLYPEELQMKHRASSKHATPDGQPLAMFTEVHVESLNLTVIAIRGTDLGRLSDFVEDMKLWTEPFTFMMLAAVFPTVRLWPDETKLTLIQWLQETLKFFGMKYESEYYKVLVKRVKELKDHKVVLTGHSLGGGLGHVVGSMVDAPSIAFSPPGIGQSYKKYSFLVDDEERYIDPRYLHHLKMSVLTDFDWIPMVDSQVGLIQKVICEKPRMAHQNACHMMEGTICSILNHCGDARQRFVGCDWKFDVSKGWPFAQELLLNHAHWVISGLMAVLVTVAAMGVPSYI